MQFQRFIRKAHKILSVVVFVQVLFWMVSGLYMTSVPLDTIHGDHLIQRHAAQPLQQAESMALNRVLSAYPTTEKVSYFTRVDGLPIFELTGAFTQNQQKPDTHLLYLNANTGNLAKHLDEATARKVATQAYTGRGAFKQMIWIEDPSTVSEIRGRNGPLWQAQFDNFLNDTLYINANTADITAVRSDLWRWFDFLWMLHIMDYDTRDNFNNPLVILMASLGLLVTLSGILMLTRGLKKQGWAFLK